MRLPPLLRNKFHRRAAVFTPENLLREARRQKRIAKGMVPEICVLDPDGDLVRHLRRTGAAELSAAWACYHTELYEFCAGGERLGVLGCAVGAPFAVLVTEEMFASGCKLVVSVTSAGQILAHLGNGASLAAVRDGKSIDTSMGFMPTAGLVMSTRSGDLDPGLAPYLARTERITTQQFYEMVNHKSGLLGVSETSSDMRDLLDHEAHDVRAAEAVALFCYQAKKWIGSFTAALGGLDTLVFAGGIGENAPLVRARICVGLSCLGVELNESRNAETAGVISTDASRVTVRVIRTDEELMIARSVLRSCAAILAD